MYRELTAIWQNCLCGGRVKGGVGGVRVSDGVRRLARARVSATGSRGAGKRGSIH